MSKQIYIDSNGNEIQVSGTVNSADMLPIEAGSSKMTSEAIGDLSSLTTTNQDSLVEAVNEVNDNKLDVDFEIGTRNYICICGSTQTANNKQLAINFSLCKQRTITVNSITTAGDVTEYKSKFTLADNSANGYITLYSADSSVVHGRIYTVNLTIA